MSNAVTYTQSPFNKSRKDKFLMTFDLPKCFKHLESDLTRSNNTIIPNSIKFSVFGAIVPSIEVPPIDIRYSGQTLAASSHTRTVYQPNTVNFTVDNRFNNYWVIYSWLNLLNDAKTGVYDSAQHLHRQCFLVHYKLKYPFLLACHLSTLQYISHRCTCKNVHLILVLNPLPNFQCSILH